jgi:pimeloyl-ACP methyl ester carboxylesterase
MAHLSAVDTAADIERIRQALSPNEGLVAYAGSYGTVYAAAYLERYGDRVKAMVLDAVVDHSIDLPTMITRNILSVAGAFDRFAQWCDRDSTCALHGQDPGKVFDAVGVTAPVTRTLVPQLLAAGRDPQLGWPAIAQMLAQTSRGETSFHAGHLAIVGVKIADLVCGDLLMFTNRTRINTLAQGARLPTIYVRPPACRCSLNRQALVGGGHAIHVERQTRSGSPPRFVLISRTPLGGQTGPQRGSKRFSGG